MSKDGKILSLVSFPAYDERYARILRENAVEGLLISTDIEPGFSGGPTTNEAGEVVGVNVTKDRAHVGQNGAVSVTALRELVKKVKPAPTRTPSRRRTTSSRLLEEDAERVPAAAARGAHARFARPSSSTASDLPALRRLVGEVRREERNTDTSFIAKYKLSGQAALGIFFARLPGKLLETYRAPRRPRRSRACELREPAPDELPRRSDRGGDKHDRTDARTCRPRAIAATSSPCGRSRGTSSPRRCSGTARRRSTPSRSSTSMDDEGRVYRASVRISGAPNLVELWSDSTSRAARLKLFDPTSNLYAIKSPRTVSSAALQGTWTMSRPRVTDAINKDAEIESDETLVDLDRRRSQGLDPLRLTEQLLQRRQQGRAVPLQRQDDDRDRPPAELHRHARQRRRRRVPGEGRRDDRRRCRLLRARATSADRIVAAKLAGRSAASCTAPTATRTPRRCSSRSNSSLFWWREERAAALQWKHAPRLVGSRDRVCCVRCVQ